jgi:antitoxin component YwqK of YwqJK toxin-antitoxin module
MKNIYFVFLLVFNFSLFGQTFKINYKTYNKDFVERNEKLYFKGKLFSGILYENLSNGNPKYIFIYKNGKKNGLQKKFNIDNGKLESRINYINGVTEGEFFHYYSNGEVRSKGIILHDERGEILSWENYYENGNLEQVGKQINDNRIGPFSWYYENGNLKRKGYYTEGLGNFYSEEYYENGVLEGKGYYESGVKNGNWEFRYENGKFKGRGIYKLGLKIGNWLEVEDTPEGKTDYSIGGYKNGERKGVWKRHTNTSIQEIDYGN